MRAVVERRDRGAGLDLLADVDAEDPHPAVERRAHHPPLQRELGVAHLELGLADRKRRLGQLDRALHVRANQLLVPLQGGAGIFQGQPRPVDRDLLGLRIEPHQRRAGGDEIARLRLDAHHAAGDIGGDRHRPRGDAVADRRDRIVDRGAGDRNPDCPRRPGAAGRAAALRSAAFRRPDRGGGDSGAFEECRRDGEIARPHPDRGREHDERDRCLLPDLHGSPWCARRRSGCRTARTRGIPASRGLACDRWSRNGALESADIRRSRTCARAGRADTATGPGSRLYSVSVTCACTFAARATSAAGKERSAARFPSRLGEYPAPPARSADGEADARAARSAAGNLPRAFHLRFHTENVRL